MTKTSRRQPRLNTGQLRCRTHRQVDLGRRREVDAFDIAGLDRLPEEAGADAHEALHAVGDHEMHVPGFAHGTQLAGVQQLRQRRCGSGGGIHDRHVRTDDRANRACQWREVRAAQHQGVRRVAAGRKHRLQVTPRDGFGDLAGSQPSSASATNNVAATRNARRGRGDGLRPGSLAPARWPRSRSRRCVPTCSRSLLLRPRLDDADQGIRG
jgi:hypothetical protein